MIKTLLTTAVMVLVATPLVAQEELPLGERSIFSDRATEQRLQPAGSVCVQGQDCATQMAAAASGGDGSSARSGSAINDQYCSTCHKSGAAGAPVTGDKAAWAPRIDKGMETLVKNAWEGFKGMPAKGMCSDCSKEEIKAAVQYQVNQAK